MDGNKTRFAEPESQVAGQGLLTRAFLSQ